MEYSGGRLVYFTKSGAHAPRRPAGTTTIHNNTTVHGVTPMLGEVRYGLFFLAGGDR
jgi:predicted 2-oxoglutarate/Fe(II)-dependent dioxygenase YbiX